jgi:hypothetical protein
MSRYQFYKLLQLINPEFLFVCGSQINGRSPSYLLEFLQMWWNQKILNTFQLGGMCTGIINTNSYVLTTLTGCQDIAGV